MLKRVLAVAIVGAVGLHIGSATATPMTDIFNADFSSPIQSFWGPGQSSANFSYNHFILGDSSFGMRFQTGASTGTVKSQYNGGISVGYNNQVQQGLADLSLGFQGDPNGGNFNTLLGAYADVVAYFPYIGAQTVTNPNYSLQTGNTFTPSPPQYPSGSDYFTPASSSIGPTLPFSVASAQAGINYNIVQNSTFTINQVTGFVRATHEGDNVTVLAPFSLMTGSTFNVALNLDLSGIWNVQLLNLGLDNLFSTTFSLAFQPFIEYTVGFNCDPYDPANNGFGCISDGGLRDTVASFPFYSNNPFGLNETWAGSSQSFQINVAASTVPDPTTIALVGIGLLGLGFSRRKRAS